MIVLFWLQNCFFICDCVFVTNAAPRGLTLSADNVDHYFDVILLVSPCRQCRACIGTTAHRAYSVCQQTN